MKSGKVYYKDIFAGIISEMPEGGFVFQYDEKYVEAWPEEFLSFTMPVQKEAYHSDRLFPFFDGLIPEGWLLDIASRNWKINAADRMGLLLACCKNCIGAVSVIPITDNDEE